MNVTKETLQALVDPVLELVAKKNQDYGSSVFHHGDKGIYLRMTDKMARLKRLVWEQAEAQVANEAVLDTVRDIIGYAALWLVLEEQKGGTE